MSLLSSHERLTLLGLARAAVESRVLTREPPEWSAAGGRLLEPGAAFVTLHCGDHLRGCLGCIEPSGSSLASVVIRMAGAAAAEDPRFAPLMADELHETRIGISVLGPLLPIADPCEIVIGRDGLVVEKLLQRGLLLPQVALEFGWTVETFLSETCRKAGLPQLAWRDGATLYRFEAEVFSD